MIKRGSHDHKGGGAPFKVFLPLIYGCEYLIDFSFFMYQHCIFMSSILFSRLLGLAHRLVATKNQEASCMITREGHTITREESHNHKRGGYMIASLREGSYVHKRGHLITSMRLCYRVMTA